MKKIMFDDRFGLTQAVLEGRKTMTRRLINENYESVSCMNVNYEDHWHGQLDGETFELIPRFKPCEVVAVAQAYKDIIGDRVFFKSSETGVSVHRSIMEREKGWSKKMFVASEFMPNRIRITGIKIERLQDISEEDCMKEGVLKKSSFPRKKSFPYYFAGGKHEWDNSFRTPREAFAALIDRISGKGTWERNPWVFAYTFELLINQLNN